MKACKSRISRSVFLISIVLVMCAPAVAQHTGDDLGATFGTPAGATITKPIMDLKEFYKWYIHSINPYKKATNPYEGGRAILKRYVTRAFLRAIERNEKLPEDADAFDADYFLLDQDTSGYKEKNVFVSKVAIKGTTGTAIVSFYRGDNRGVKVSLIQEGGVWKIDKVKDESGAGLVK